MAPQQSGNILVANQAAQVHADKYDINHNNIANVAASVQKPAPVQQQQQPRPQRRTPKPTDVNERTRTVIRNCLSHLNTNLNVLVIGGSGSGKSSLINSMNMALDQKWRDCAKYYPGRNHVIDECVLFHNRGQGGKVVFWDTRGFEGIHEDEHAVLILRYVLEGRIPPKCIPCVLLMSKEIIKKRYHRVADPHRRIDMVMYVSDFCQQPEVRLMGLLAQAMNQSKIISVNNVPIISVVTKSDTLPEDEVAAKKKTSFDHYNLEYTRLEMELQSLSKRQQKIFDRSPKEDWPICKARFVNNYRCELEPWNDEPLDPSAVLTCQDRDATFLAIWREIVSRTAACGGSNPRKRAYSSASASRPLSRCLPFRIDYMRLRSASF